MLKLARLGVVFLPPVTEFYTNPTSIDAMIDHIVGKCLDQFDIEHDLFTRWGSKQTKKIYAGFNLKIYAKDNF